MLPLQTRREISPRLRHLKRLSAATLSALLGATLLGACADDGGSGSAAGDSGGEGKTTVSVGVFGVFGYKQAGLYDEYERNHPDIRIKENATERNEDYYPALLNHLAAGSGLNDIQAVEVDNVNEMATLQADRLTDLKSAPGVRESDFLDWKWDQAKTKDGKVIGLGTDIGPMGVCYRKDHFKKAGLPTDRDKVGKLWAGDWEKYVETGERFMDKAPKGVSFMDGASGLYNASVSGYERKNYAPGGKLIYKKSQAVEESWDLAMRAVKGKTTARLKQFDTQWDQAYSNGAFATVVCPPWMLGYIKEKSGTKGADKWDVAPAPKPANWGGSFLSVPAKAKNRDEAVKLAAWLTAPEQQEKLFKKQASFPSSTKALESTGVRGARHAYFDNAPIGRIFSDAALEVPKAVLGPKDQIIKQYITDIGILQVEQQGKSPGQGWDAAVKKIDDAVED
ncbi:extracellular solute-binding protein [Streptomyces iconiensis]|uniref:ABC transporter substrate-binding protein n=1 Tax=Streptomyces iconiensis TaxID=1384038 RepID=A0ABT6ZWV2_9ACTN|nr:ABC transporter substrate-binding protein [Streptomyces iconiensis]MDJ1133317.1 ABC transporter substrate-binding protein [Streptomyces iconiensis]